MDRNNVNAQPGQSLNRLEVLTLLEDDEGCSDEEEQRDSFALSSLKTDIVSQEEIKKSLDVKLQ